MCKGKTDNVTCQICNQIMSFGRIKRHLNIKHKDITLEDYFQKHYKTLPLHNPCVICNNKIVYKYQTCSKECHSILTSQKLTNKVKPEGFMNQEHKNKLSIKQKHRWILGKTTGFTGKTHTKKTKQKQRENIIKTKPHLGYKQSEYQKQQASLTMKKWYAEGNQPWTKNNKHTPETIEKIIKNSRKGMNKIEKQVSDFLNENNIKYYFNFFINNGKICKQYDFKIGNILLEIDGDYWHGGPGVEKHHFSVEKNEKNDLLKNQLAKEKGYRLIRIWESEIKNNPNIILERINNV